MLRSRWTQVVVIIALLAMPFFMFGERALAVQDSEDKILFGPLGIGVGQAARINVYAIGNPDIIGNPNELTWDFRVRTFNRRGALVQERKFQVAVGAIGSFEISVQDPENFPVDRLGRRTLRAEIVGFNPQPDPPGKFSATLEVYSLLTGHTSLLLAPIDFLRSPAVIGPSTSGE